MRGPTGRGSDHPGAGHTAASGCRTTDSEGKATVGLEPGGYIVTPQPVDGLLGTPDPVELNLQGHRLIVFSYDTGIR